jgi:hypothetical protein
VIGTIRCPEKAATALVNVEENSKWRNQMRDVLVAWDAFIMVGRSFVTRIEDL